MPVKACRTCKSFNKLAIIAGVGDLPIAIASGARKTGYEIIGIALQPPADESLQPFVDDFYKIRIGRFGSLLELLKKLNIREIVMAGKVPKKLLYKNKIDAIPDLKATKLLFSLKNLSDDTIMSAIVAEIEKKGIIVHETATFARDLLVPEGVLTRKKPSKEHMKDIEFGWNIAKHIGRLDIGQTLVVKNRAVMAVEAIEGTDEAIKRGGQLAESDAVVIKVSKPQQDPRYDVPTVGVSTLLSMKKARCQVLALEAGKCIMIDKAQCIREADKAGIILIGIKR